MRRIGALLTAVIALAGAGSAHAAVPGAVPRAWFGLTSEDLFAGDAAYRAATLDDQWGVGVGTIRQTFHWEQIEPSRGSYDFSAYDPYVAALARRGMQLVPLLFGEPAWATSRPAGDTRSGTFPPADPNDMGDFAAALVRRYGPSGSFWAANATVPKVPVRSWQVWNEPNLKAYWPDGPDPAAYTTLLRAVSSAIRAADPGAGVITAGLPTSATSGSIPREEFLAGMYAAGAKGTFTAVGVNRYGQDDAVMPSVQSTRAVMSQNGDASSILVSETGFASGGPSGTGSVGGEQAQAMDVKCSLLKVALNRNVAKVNGYLYFDWRDAAPYKTDFWGLHTGLLRIDGTRKAAYDAYAAEARRLETPPAGNWSPRACFRSTALRPYTGDKVTFTSTSIDPEGPIAAQAWDLDDDGSFDDGTTYQASSAWPSPGTYLVRLRVTDGAGATDVSAQEITVRSRPAAVASAASARR